MLVKREIKGEGGAGAQDAVYLNGPFVQFQDLSGDSKPETGMPGLFFSAFVQLEFTYYERG